METNLNGIVLGGKFYEQMPDGEATNGACEGCDLEKFNCCLADYCIEYECHFRFSPELTEKLNGE